MKPSTTERRSVANWCTLGSPSQDRWKTEISCQPGKGFVHLARRMSILLIALFLQVTQAEKVRMCYFTNWSQYRPGQGRFSVQDIDPALCTHLLYAFSYLDVENESLRIVEWNDYELYEQMIALKDKNPELKVLLAVGGARFGTGLFEAMASSKEKTERFVQNAISFLRQRGFDGLDVDWEFPNESTKSDYQRFIQLLSVGFLTESVASGRERLYLTITVSGNPVTVQSIYGPSDIVRYVDFVLLMAYDLWGPWSVTLGHQSPLREVLPGHWEQGQYSMNKLVEEWEVQGAPAEKLVLGMATYGRTGILKSAKQHRPGDLWTRRPSPAGPFTSTDGVLAYYEICTMLKTPSWNIDYMKSSEAPYAWNSKTLEYVSYDNPRSFRAKAEYIVEKDLAGAMFWNLDLDDFSGQFCSDGRYPLLRRVKATFDDQETPDHTPTSLTSQRTITTSPTVITITPKTTTTTTTTKTTTTTTTTTTTASPATTKTRASACPPFQCPSVFGHYPDPADCSRFYQCAWRRAYRKNCPAGLRFDRYRLQCDWPALAQCQDTC